MEQNEYGTEKITDGSVIVEEGTDAYWAYVIHDGKAKVWKKVGGKQVQIGTLKKGDVFGEMAERLNAGIKGCTQQASQIKEAGKAIESLSPSLTENPIEQ